MLNLTGIFKDINQPVSRTQCRGRKKPLLSALCVLTTATFSIFIFASFYFASNSRLSARYDKYILNHFKVNSADCATLFNDLPNRTREVYRNITTQHSIELHQFLNASRSEPNFCEKFRRERRYVTEPLCEEEANFGIAYTITIYKDVAMFERLLRAIYRPQNVYCIHVDRSSSSLIHQGARAIAKCFENVFIPQDLVDVVHATITVLEAELICMRELLKYARWKYLINLTGQEFPLRTNWELVRMLTIFSGANSIEACPASQMQWFRYKGALPFPPNVTIVKGAVHIAASRAFVDYAINNEEAIRFLTWVRKTKIPDEAFFTSLHYSPQLKVPGAFIGPPESYVNNNLYMARFKNWKVEWGTINLPCAGKYVRGICIFGVGDLKVLGSRPEMFANKFNADFEPLAYDCMEELLHNRTRRELERGEVELNETFYSQLAFVKSHV